MGDESASLPPLGSQNDPLAYVRKGYTLTWREWPRGPLVSKAVNTYPVGAVTTGPLAFPGPGA